MIGQAERGATPISTVAAPATVRRTSVWRRGTGLIGRVLSTLGRHGPLLLALSLVAGWVAPDLSQAARPWLPLAAFLLVLGSFLSAALARHDSCRLNPQLLIAIAFAALAPPVVVALALQLAPFDADIELAALLAALAPPTGSLAAIAAMLALRPRFALALMLALTVSAPFAMPLLMGLFQLGGQELWAPMALRLAMIVGAAALIAAPPVCSRLERVGVLPDSDAASGVAVIGLVVVGVATAGGVAALADAPDRLVALVGLAIGLNVLLVSLGAALFWRHGLATALTVGFAAGNRNVTLVWAAGASVLPVAAQTYLAVCVAPILLLPLVLKLILAARSRLPHAEHPRP